MKFTILLYNQAPSMTLMQYAGHLYKKVSKVEDVSDQFTLNDIFIEGGDFSICHSLWEYGVFKPQTDLTDIVFYVHLLLAIPKGSAELSHAGNQNNTAKNFGKGGWHNKTARVVDSGSTTSPSQ